MSDFSFLWIVHFVGMGILAVIALCLLMDGTLRLCDWLVEILFRFTKNVAAFIKRPKN